MQISVVICTHNPRQDYLHQTLESLQAQRLPLARWELLLIDNASEVPLSSSFDLNWHPQARHILEMELGLTSARLRGIGESNADILVFVDDDNLLDPNYLEQVLVIAEQWPFIGVWGASVSPKFESTPPEWAKNQIWRLSVDEVPEDVWSNLREGFETKPLGAGMCVRKEVAAHYLEWCRSDEKSMALDRKGNSITGYGDMNLSLSAIDLGLGTGKSSRLRLTHLIPSSRLTLDYFIRHAEGDAASLLMFRAIRGLPLKESRLSLYKTLKWQLYKLFSRQPREILQIHDAHLRGTKRGLEMAHDYLEKKRGKTQHGQT